MSPHAQPHPPVLAGYQHIRPIGVGGFANVHLYERDFPRTQVAVKVLTAQLDSPELRTMFLTEANALAQLSEHPSVLTIHTADVAPDGRPYLVTEYCPGSYGADYKRQPLDVATVLRIGVRIGSALESAHRTGLLHRDVKPANVLRTRYGNPVLADFGIATTITQRTTDGTTGLTVPWSAPELLRGETTGTIATDLYAFAATLYSLLLGRTPYERPGDAGTAGRRELLQQRILGRDLPEPLQRSDVPDRLERTLLAAMNKQPARRPARVLDLVRQLQIIEQRLGYPPTPAELAAEPADHSGGFVFPEAPARLAIPAAAPGRRPRKRREPRPLEVGDEALRVGGIPQMDARRTRRGRTSTSRPGNLAPGRAGVFAGWPTALLGAAVGAALATRGWLLIPGATTGAKQPERPAGALWVVVIDA